ncbi:hypothetical protein MP228_004586 [Amoeboaphelidium protococcarum]|nr:hypothetical protein MP228_004586 [Amoeboaphelidium protococcarum]
MKRALDLGKARAILSQSDFEALSAIRNRQMELERVISTPVPAVDMERYKQLLKSDEGVSVLQSVLKEVGAFQPKKADVSSVLNDLDAQEVDALQRAKETVESVKAAVSGFKKDLDSIKNLAHYDQLTPEEIYEAAPGLEQVYHERLRQGKVFHDGHDFGEKFLG